MYVCVFFSFVFYSLSKFSRWVCFVSATNTFRISCPKLILGIDVLNLTNLSLVETHIKDSVGNGFNSNNKQGLGNRQCNSESFDDNFGKKTLKLFKTWIVAHGVGRKFRLFSVEFHQSCRIKICLHLSLVVSTNFIALRNLFHYLQKWVSFLKLKFIVFC